MLRILAILLLITLVQSDRPSDQGHGRGGQSPGGQHGGGQSSQHGGGQGGQVGSANRTSHGKGSDVHPSIRAERERLGRLSNRFVGQMNPHGSNKHGRKKEGKKEKPKNPKLILWHGQAKLVKGLSADDKPDNLSLPENVHLLQKHGRTCLEGKQFKRLNSTEMSGGPSQEGLNVNDFKPCLERRRGRKDDDSPQQDAPMVHDESAIHNQYSKQAERSRRVKRAESYSILALLWKDPSRGVPYTFDRYFPIQYKPYIRNAINFWQNSTCLRFVEKPSTTGINEPFIQFTRGDNGCSTNRLGPNPNPPYSTIIDIGTCENLTGSIAHEIGHAMGLAHSQKRVDRERAVKLYFQNIAPNWVDQFEQNPMQYFDSWGVPYYYDSIMHYFPYAASQNGLMTICPLDPMMELVIGQREEPAFGDISLMNRIYCQESCFPKAQLRGMQFYGNKSMTISGRTCQNWGSQTPTRHRFTSVGNHSSCRNPDNWEGGPWCFTTDPQVRLEPCFSPCEDLAATNRPKCQGWCYNGGYHHPRTCACVCPPFASGQYCETVNKEKLYTNAHLDCGSKVELRTGQRVTITSPNYPTNYPLQKACMWWIQAPNNTRVKITLQDFQIENADVNGCYDYLEIRPSICASAIEPVDDMRFCGDSLAPVGTQQKALYSDDNNMVLKFYSDETEPAKGFKATVEIASISG